MSITDNKDIFGYMLDMMIHPRVSLITETYISELVPPTTTYSIMIKSVVFEFAIQVCSIVNIEDPYHCWDNYDGDTITVGVEPVTYGELMWGLTRITTENCYNFKGESIKSFQLFHDQIVSYDGLTSLKISPTTLDEIIRVVAELVVELEKIFGKLNYA